MKDVSFSLSLSFYGVYVHVQMLSDTHTHTHTSSLVLESCPVSWSISSECWPAVLPSPHTAHSPAESAHGSKCYRLSAPFESAQANCASEGEVCYIILMSGSPGLLEESVITSVGPLRSESFKSLATPALSSIASSVCCTHRRYMCA